MEGESVETNAVSVENKQKVQLGHVREPMRTKQESHFVPVGAISLLCFPSSALIGKGF